jgi:glycosyltransferase involved in cell wall biosynthesis
MNKLRIGVYVNDEFKPVIGGGYSYYQQLINKINQYEFDKEIEIYFISNNHMDSTLFKKKILQIPYSKFKNEGWTFKNRFLNKLFSLSFLRPFEIYIKFQNKIDKQITNAVSDFLKLNKIDLVYYLTPNLYPLNYPFITTHWDLGHKTMFAFPEVSMKKKFEKREIYHRSTLQKAFAIFVESEQSRKELIYYEKINEDRIFNVPLFPGKVTSLTVNDEEQKSIIEKWNLKKNGFYFYPAQFWAHKNHFGLIIAFKKVSMIYPDFKLVLSGSDKGNLNYIKTIVEQNNLTDKVVFTGFVSDEEIFTFYKNAISLVMPTYLGPTNMPLLEAYALGCKVLCSDLVGHREQMKEKAIYFDPKDVNDISEKMIESINMKRKNVIQSEVVDTASLLNNHFMQLYNIRKTFGYEY